MTLPGGPAWTCSTCGAEHRGLATVFGSASPYPWDVASAAQRDAGELTDDVCFLPGGDAEGGTAYFLRGHVELPLLEPVGGETTFSWSVWVSVSGDSLDLIFDHWEDPDRAETLPPVFGWLCSELPYEPSTLGLRTQVHTREPGLVPRIEIEPTTHPLAREQAEGITLHRVAELNAAILGELH